jgi:hypothetical protein
MKRKALLLTAVLAARAGWSNSARGSAHFNLTSPQSQDQSLTGPTAAEQSRLVRHSLHTERLAETCAAKLLRSANQDRVDYNELQQRLSQVRSSLNVMSKDHKRFLYTLTEGQWTAAKEPIARLERLRASIQAQLEGIDLELQMPSPDSRNLVRDGKRVRGLLRDWREQYRKMTAAAGIDSRLGNPLE